MSLGSMAVLESHNEEEDRWRGVPLAAKGQHQPIMSFFTPTTEIFAGKWDFAKMERRRSM